MQVPLWMGPAIAGGLVKSHGIWKRDLEELIITSGQRLQRVRQRVFLVSGKLNKRAQVFARENQSFKRPDGPERNEHCEILVFEYDSLAAFSLHSEVVAQQARMPHCLVLALGYLFLRGLVRDTGACPDLTVR